MQEKENQEFFINLPKNYNHNMTVVVSRQLLVQQYIVQISTEKPH